MGGLFMGQEDSSKEILVAIAELQRDIQHLSKQIDKVPEMAETLIKNTESSKSAHLRIDRIEDNQRWAWRSIGGIVIAFVMDKLFM